MWDYLPQETQQTIIDKGLRFFVVDAYMVAEQTNMGRRINTVMQTCFFALIDGQPRPLTLCATGPSPRSKEAIAKTYGKRGGRSLSRTTPPSMRHFPPV